jgi:hypothetical protein
LCVNAGVKRSDRTLLAAAVLSAGFHLVALFGVPLFAVGAREVLPPAVIEARIVNPPPPRQAVTPKPVARAARTPRKVQTAPEPLREAVVPSYDYPVLDPAPVAASEHGPAAPGAEAPVSDEPLPVEAAEAPTPPAEYPLKTARLVFDLYFGSTATKVGQVTHTWERDGARYRVESVAEAVGFVSLFLGGRFVQRSSGVLATRGLLPSEYRAEATSRERTQIARFDWAGRKVALADKGATRLVDLPDGAQDPLSMVHQLWFMRPMPAAARLDIATGRKLYEQVYRIVGETEFETPVGVVRAVQLSRRDADGERMDVWLDLDRSFLPARIHFVDRKGMELAQVIREARIELVETR